MTNRSKLKHLAPTFSLTLLLLPTGLPPSLFFPHQFPLPCSCSPEVQNTKLGTQMHRVLTLRYSCVIATAESGLSWQPIIYGRMEVEKEKMFVGCTFCGSVGVAVTCVFPHVSVWETESWQGKKTLTAFLQHACACFQKCIDVLNTNVPHNICVLPRLLSGLG